MFPVAVLLVQYQRNEDPAQRTKKPLRMVKTSQDNQISDNTRLELNPHFWLHCRRANQPLHPQTSSRQLHHVAVERCSNFEFQLEVIFLPGVDIDRLFSSFVIHLRQDVSPKGAGGGKPSTPEGRGGGGGGVKMDISQAK